MLGRYVEILAWMSLLVFVVRLAGPPRTWRFMLLLARFAPTLARPLLLFLHLVYWLFWAGIWFTAVFGTGAQGAQDQVAPAWATIPVSVLAVIAARRGAIAARAWLVRRHARWRLSRSGRRRAANGS